MKQGEILNGVLSSSQLYGDPSRDLVYWEGIMRLAELSIQKKKMDFPELPEIRNISWKIKNKVILNLIFLGKNFLE